MEIAYRYIKQLLRGAGQVMFMENALTGFLFLTGIFVGSYSCGTPAVAWGALVGLLSANIAGQVIYRNGGESGLWGFNGILVGCALPTLFEPTPGVWAAVIILSVLTVILSHRISLTAPFILMTWLAFAFRFAPAETILQPHSLPEAWLCGISEVFLVCSPWCGLLFLAGLAVGDIKAAVWCAIGSAAGMALAYIFGFPEADISAGLYGFNPALTGIAIGAVYKRNVAVTAAAIIATFFIQLGLSIFLPPFTAPFCLATWGTELLCKRLGRTA